MIVSYTQHAGIIPGQDLANFTTPVLKFMHGTLPDHEIRSLVESGHLIVKNFDKNNIRQACYEIRAGHIYYDISHQAQRLNVPSDGYILLKPRQTIVIITLEELALPNDVLGRILTKGQLFSIGIQPVNTYADPGFQGNLGIVLFNSSTKYLKIRPGDPIAKIEFSRFYAAVDAPYNGQHGFQTEIWPISDKYFLSVEEYDNDKRIESWQKELELSYGEMLANPLRRVFRFEKILIVGAAFYFATMLLLIGLTESLQGYPLILSITAGIVANLLTALVTAYATSLRRRPLWKSKT